MAFSYVLFLLLFSWAQGIEDLEGLGSTHDVNCVFAHIIPVESHYSVLLQYKQEKEDESNFMIIPHVEATEIQEQYFFNPKLKWNVEAAVQVRGISAFHYYDSSRGRMYIFYSNKNNELRISYSEDDETVIPGMETKKSESIYLTDPPQVINGHFFLVLEKRKRGMKSSRTYLLRSSDFLEKLVDATWEILPAKGIKSKEGETEKLTNNPRKNVAKSYFSNTQWDPTSKCTLYPSLLQVNSSRIMVMWVTEVGLIGRVYGDNLGESFTDEDWVRFDGKNTPVLYKKLESHLLRHKKTRTGITTLRDGTIVMATTNSRKKQEGERFYWLFVGEVTVDDEEGDLIKWFQPELLYKAQVDEDEQNTMVEFVEVGEKLFLVEANGLITIREVDRSLIEMIKSQDTITEVSDEKLIHAVENPRIYGLHRARLPNTPPPSNKFTIAMWVQASNYGRMHNHYCGDPWDIELARKNRCLPSPYKHEKALFLTIPGSDDSAKIEFEAYMYGVLINIFNSSDTVFRLSTMCGSKVSIWNQKHHMVAFVYDGEVLRVSIDDVLCDGDSEKGKGWIYIPEDIRIGSAVRRDSAYAGGLWKVKMYHRALRHTEVIGLWRQGHTSKPEGGDKKPSKNSTPRETIAAVKSVGSTSELREKTEL